ncbi:apolipoprotein N-acyltransferase [Cryobacterium algoritolerans]|uniref:Apolipoprotein N-acyltransferase n=1 Tax=Cryobacterium algoritolerans TaxID=1259184 RepID=A0A4R8WI76_9MICO|nr:apolipoprotein N-acyltransferase [Cryobacterium algoritolerans]
MGLKKGGLPPRGSVLLATTGGVLNALAFPGLGWWPLILVGTPMILAALVGRSVWSSLLVGAAAGFAFWGTHIYWLTVYLGIVPWLALTALETIFFALGGVLVSLAWRFTAGTFPGRWGRFGITPMIVAGLWTFREFVTSNWPYGGFSWGRLAFSQSESPFGGLTAWVGVSGLTFLLAWVSAAAVQVLRERTGRQRLTWVLIPVGMISLLVAIPTFPVVQSGTIRVATVQGNADAGLFAAYVPGEILQNHLDATEPLYGRTVDVVVWPENASDLNPLVNRQSATALDQVTGRMRAPLITGALTTRNDQVFNSILQWENGHGAVEQYDKIHPVPFAEYIPDRDFWYPLAPALFSLIPRDFTIGTRSNVFDINGVAAGIAICFDIVDDNLIRQMIAGGADVILAPSNNADFGHSDESVQQLAIARIRAIETGRSVVNASTVGTTANVGPNGGIIDQLPTFEAGALVQDVPLSTTTTLATIAGQAIELTVSGVGLAGLALSLTSARRHRFRGFPGFLRRAGQSQSLQQQRIDGDDHAGSGH